MNKLKLSDPVGKAKRDIKAGETITMTLGLDGFPISSDAIDFFVYDEQPPRYNGVKLTNFINSIKKGR